MERRGFLDFPQLTQETLIPAVFEISSGVNAVNQANSSLTYMRQIQMKGQNLSSEETERALLEPPNDWNLKYSRVCTPSTFVSTEEMPTWIPVWCEERFGPWNDITLVGCKIPPSNKSASLANYHWAVIGFGNEASARLGMDPPYNRIYFYHCFGCPALNLWIGTCAHFFRCVLSNSCTSQPIEQSIC